MKGRCCFCFYKHHTSITMNLLFDIDDTITNETGFMIQYAPAFLRRQFHQEFSINNPNGYDVSEVFGLQEYFKSLGTAPELVEEYEKKVNSAFWNKHFIKYMFFPIKDDASVIIRGLRAQGHKIHLVSLRGKKDHECESFSQKFIRTQVVSWLTKMQLKKNQIQYDSLILVANNEEKLSIAKKLKAEYVFDDQGTVLENLDESIHAVCIEAPHNLRYEFSNKNVLRIPFQLESINNILNCDICEQKNRNSKRKKQKNKIKNLKIYQRICTESFYKIARVIAKPFILKSFHPIILGEENLPLEKGADVFVSNHRNIMDPLITISIQKNPTHFAALKRMFEYNENFFGPVGKNFGTFITTFFVKSMGALPIARPGDEHYRLTNLQTFQYIHDYLENDSAIAIYPEGTLNREPNKNGNILPLKSNRAFKIAERGKGVIRPIAIVWLPPKNKFRNKVIISILKPIHTEGLCAKEISKIWESSVDKAIDSMNKIIEEMIQINAITPSN